MSSTNKQLMNYHMNYKRHFLRNLLKKADDVVNACNQFLRKKGKDWALRNVLLSQIETIEGAKKQLKEGNWILWKHHALVRTISAAAETCNRKCKNKNLVK